MILSIFLAFGILPSSSFAQGNSFMSGGAILALPDPKAARIRSVDLNFHWLQNGPCQAIEIRGKDSGVPGKAIPCKSGRTSGAFYRSDWRVSSRYEIEVLSLEKPIQVAVVIPQFITELADKYVRAPAVFNVKILIDGKKIMTPAYAALPEKVALENPPMRTYEKQGYVFHMAPGKKVKHRIEIQADQMSGFVNPDFANDEYGENREWFAKKEVYEKMGLVPAYNELNYYLKPLRSWGDAAPEKFSITVDLKEIPNGIYTFMPRKWVPKKVTETSMYFEFERSWPPEQFEAYFPIWRADGKKKAARLRPPAAGKEMETWRKSLGLNIN
ncbi:MAG: hypothetical protein JNL01_03075 [Bdellovibrionales bacterium]|nr:hypothetical protein [Bdellovibrionales bacterium]